MKLFAFVFVFFVNGALSLDLGLGGAPPNPFHWSCSSSDSVVGNGAFSLRVHCVIDKGYYIYKSKISLRPTDTSKLRLGVPVFSADALHFDSLTRKNEKVFFDSLSAVVPCSFAKTVPGPLLVKALCSYQGCMNALCFLPATDTLSFMVRVLSGSPGVDGRSKGGIVALLLAFLGGLLTCLTPCVYPLIPVTISIFGAAAAKSRLRAFGLSCLYVAGIAVMFSSMGFVLAVTGKVFGQFMSNPWIIGFIAAVFSVFGISLLGAFDMQLPPSLQNKLSGLSGKSRGRSKVFFMGLVAGIIAAPCTGPSLGAILTYVATTGSQWFGMAMLFSFSIGLGLPFLILGTFSSLVASRPKPGPWMDSIKSGLGIIMFVMALYFLRGALPGMDRLFHATPIYYALMLCSIALGIILGALHLSYHNASPLTAMRKTIGCILVTLGAFGMIGAMTSGNDANSGTTGSLQEHDVWLHDVGRGLEWARELKMPVMVDFYADWCIACKELDKTTFGAPGVQKELSRFIRIKADFTKDSPAAKQLAKEYSIRGLPVLEFYSSAGERLTDKRVIGFVNAQALADHLKSIR